MTGATFDGEEFVTSVAFGVGLHGLYNRTAGKVLYYVSIEIRGRSDYKPIASTTSRHTSAPATELLHCATLARSESRTNADKRRTHIDNNPCIHGRWGREKEGTNCH